MRKGLWGIGVIILWIVGFANAQELQDVKVATPSLKIGGILQSQWDFPMDTTKHVSFDMKRARFLLWGGVVPNKVKYFLQTDANLAQGMVLLDMKLQFFYLPQTEIAIGRFLPNFTHYMPRSTAMLDMINYPLVTTKYAMWRQVGVQTTTKAGKADFDLGIFNGYPANNWTDDNDGKDVMIRATVKPVDFIQLIGYGWMGNILLAEENDLTTNRYGGGILIDKKLNEQMSICINGECILGSNEKTADTTINSMGFYGHVGFKLNPQFEILARFDSFDPNSDVTDNEETWITGGVNYSISGDRAKIYLNYITKSETPSVDNDILSIQFQVFF